MKFTADNLIALWGIQDSLLQSYRGIFLTSLSILFGAAIVLEETSSSPLVYPLSFLGVIICVIWNMTCSYRGESVWFFQYLLLKVESGEEVTEAYSSYKEFPGSGKYSISDIKRDTIWEKYFEKSKARIVMDLVLPLCLIAPLWFFLIIYHIVKQ